MSMYVNITKNLCEANYITHGGIFHGDEVFATVILAKVAKLQGKDFKLARVFKVPENLSDDVIVYDIGGGAFDHHQKGGNGVRMNEVPYASCGIVWREFGDILTADSPNPNLVWSIVENTLIQGVDAVDNGSLPKMDYPARVLSVSSFISTFNPLWDSCEESDEAFKKAVTMAEIIFDNVLESAKAKARAEKLIEDAIEKSEGGVMVLERFAPWQEFIFSSANPKAKDIFFVVFPSNRGGYNWQGVPECPGSFNLRKPTPQEWWGLPIHELKKVTGIATATFCHNNGFLGAAETLEDTIKMARLAVRE